MAGFCRFGHFWWISTLCFFHVVVSVRPHRLNTDDAITGTLEDVLRRSRHGLRRLREGFEPQDAEEAAGVSQLSQYIANMTKEMLGILKM